MLSFFRALNPTSTDSGITYNLAGYNSCQGKEMLDYTVSERISTLYNGDFNLMDATYNALLGEHYDLSLKGRSNCKGGAKGVLDYLIFPLIARKLIADTYLDERRESSLTNVLAWSIAIPLEILRFTAAIALTLLITPVVTILFFIKDCLCDKSSEDNISVPKLN